MKKVFVTSVFVACLACFSLGCDGGKKATVPSAETDYTVQKEQKNEKTIQEEYDEAQRRYYEEDPQMKEKNSMIDGIIPRSK